MIRVTSESFESDGVRVTLEWTYKNHNQPDLHSYNVNVSPVLVLTSSERRSVDLMANYNISYNVSILVLSQCRQRIMTTTIELHYGKYCINPVHSYQQQTKCMIPLF